MTATKDEWTELVAPLIARCELAAKLDMNATWNPDGARALGELLKRMATILDDEIERQRVRLRCADTAAEPDLLYERVNQCEDILGSVLSYLQDDPQYKNAKPGLILEIEALFNERKLRRGMSPPSSLEQGGVSDRLSNFDDWGNRIRDRS